MRNIIDSHLHLNGWGKADFIDCFESYRNDKKLKAINICAIPIEQTNICNNIMVGFYKLAHPSTYAHAGLELIAIPLSENMPSGMDTVSQYRELMEIGFDGMKMLEGKPSEHKRIGKSLNHPELNRFYKELERDGTHLLMHVNDPDEFWDEKTAPDWAKENGWAYLDGSFAGFEEIKSQAIKILEEHPSIRLTLAHFFFSSKTPQLLEELFERYPNLCVDLTPGGEMYLSFADNYEYYKEFFNKYSNRIIFGTDRSFPEDEKYADWAFDVVRTFIETDITKKGFGDISLTGLGLSSEGADNILFKNFEGRVGSTPRPINREKFKAYIEKYKFALTKEDLEKIKPLCERYL